MAEAGCDPGFQLIQNHRRDRGQVQSFGLGNGDPGEFHEFRLRTDDSFNLFGEPVVSTPREAVRGFYCSGIDCLALENFLIKK